MIVTNSTYNKPSFISGEHIETIIPSVFRHVKQTPTNKERIYTPDKDFLDLDWHKVGSDKLVIVSHGLEGSSKSEYALGIAKYFNHHKIDALCWNYRGCSEEMNLTSTFYHSGATYDLETIIKHAITKKYNSITLIGFSLGGNLTLKFLGETPNKYPSIKASVIFSVPFDLSTGCDEISKIKNIHYAFRFLRKLKKKVKAKHQIMGNNFPLNGVESISTIKEFDNVFTAPLHGFKDADEYYQKSSSIHYLASINTPTLIINALNDPFLPETCYPTSQLKEHKYIWLETPKHGGHVGFGPAAKDGSYWSERRAFEFIKEFL